MYCATAINKDYCFKYSRKRIFVTITDRKITINPSLLKQRHIKKPFSAFYATRLRNFILEVHVWLI